MPNMDGFEVVKAIKNNIETSHIPVILLSARTSEDVRLEGYLAAYELADKTTGEIFADGNRFTEYLDLQSRLDRYSVTNVLLVLAHNPNATQLRSKASWAEEGASILQDQKAIPIIEPGDKFYRDDDTRGTYYNVKWVYDISQTDAKAEPTPSVNRDERQLLSALIAKRPVPIELTVQFHLLVAYHILKILQNPYQYHLLHHYQDLFPLIDLQNVQVDQLDH